MSDTNANPASPSNTPGNAGSEQGRGCGSRRGCGRGRGVFAVAFLLLTGAAVGSIASKAFSHGHFGHGMHHGGSVLTQIAAPGKAVDPAVAEARAERMARHLGVEVDATKEQQEKIDGIVKAAVKDLLPLREKMQGARKDVVDLLSAASIDKSAVERIRGEQMSSADAATKRLSQAIVDIAEVLTPEQRKKAADRIQAFREHRGWGGWHKG